MREPNFVKLIFDYSSCLRKSKCDGTVVIGFNSVTEFPLPLSSSCVTQTETARKKWPREIQKFARPFLSRSFLSRHT